MKNWNDIPINEQIIKQRNDELQWELMNGKKKIRIQKWISTDTVSSHETEILYDDGCVHKIII